MEQKFEQTKEILQELFNAFPYGVMIVGQDKTIRMINGAGVNLMGFTNSDDIINTRCSQRICHDHQDDCPIIDGKKMSDLSESILVQKSGVEIPITKYAVPIHFGDGDFILETFMDLTERNKRMELVTDTQRQFSALLGNLPGIVYRCRNDENWTMEFISKGCKELTGYLPEDLILNKVVSFNSVIFPEDRDHVRRSILENIRISQPFTIEYRITRADGKIRWVWENGRGVFDSRGTLLYLEGFITDITEQKHSELRQKVLFDISKASYTAISVDDIFRSIHETLKQIIDAENFYIAIYDKTNDTLALPYQVDSKDKFAVFPAGKTLTGYVVQIRKPLLATENIIKDLAATGQIEIVGSPAKVWLGAPLIISGDVIGVIAVQSYTDPGQYTYQELELLKFVADHIAIVISRKRVEESFQKEKAYLDQLFEGSSEAIIMLDIHGNITKINSEFIRLFGYTEPEIVGKPIDDFIATPEYLNEAKEITSGVFQRITASLETKRKHKDGRLIDVSLLVTPIIIDNHTAGAYGIYRDITDRKRIEKNLIAAKEKAEESDKLKSAFLSNMSHEIRTPMNAILGFSTLLSDPGVSEEEKAEFIHIIRERGNDLLRIIDDIIDVAKIESGQIKIEIKECAVNQLLTNLTVTLNEVKRKTAKNNIILNCLPANNNKDFTILTDGNRLRQVMTNLIENSLKFTHDGFVEFGYVLKNIDDSPYIEFFVRDSGIGIPEEMHEIIFERFRQVDDTNTRKYGGTGLGLTISKNLVKLLGGEIHLTSEKDKGTTFHVLLPLMVPTVQNAETPPLPPVTISTTDWAKRIILVVEDEDSNFFLMDRILKRTGVKLIWAKNGMDAIEICKTQSIDIILMDIRMPVMDGYEATQIIKKDHPQIPVIAQTAYALKGEKEKSLAAGCDNYIAKPIDAKELLAILRQYLDTKQG